MNIGTITQNASCTYIGKISTLTVAIVIALRTAQSANPRVPKFEILALCEGLFTPRLRIRMRRKSAIRTGLMASA
jgi:hypothetical protein